MSKLLISLPENWQLTTLEQICNSIRGVTFNSSEASLTVSNDNIACLTTSAVQDQIAWETHRYIPANRVVNPQQFLQKGDLLVSTANSKSLVGKSCLVEEIPYPCTFGAFVTVLRPNSLIDPILLGYWMRSSHALNSFLETSSNTTGISNLRVSDLMALQIPLPPLPEQRQIVKVLRQAEDLRRLRYQATQRTTQLIPAFFHRMFGDPSYNTNGWPIVPLFSLIEDSQYGLSTSLKEIGDICTLRMNNITLDGRLNFSEMKYLAKDEVDFTKYDLRTGDILFNRTNSKELVGKTGLWEDIPGKYTFASYIIRVRLKEDVLPEYIWSLMNSPYGKGQVAGLGKQAVNMANINTLTVHKDCGTREIA